MKRKKNQGGRPKRFEGEYGTISIQLSKDLIARFDGAAKVMGMSKSRFGQYLFERWLSELSEDSNTNDNDIDRSAS